MSSSVGMIIPKIYGIQDVPNHQPTIVVFVFLCLPEAIRSPWGPNLAPSFGIGNMEMTTAVDPQKAALAASDATQFLESLFLFG